MTLRGLLLLGLLIATPTLAASPLTEAQVRALAGRQSSAWNAGQLDAYFSTFTPEARFTDQALSNENKLVPYGVSSLHQARVQARKVLQTSKVRESSTITAVAIAPGGASARVTASTISDITSPGGARRVCAVRVSNVVATPAGPRTSGPTDTIVRCRPGRIR
jgi:hypothetical protein